MSDKESLDSIEENVLDEETGIIMKLIQKETLSQFLTTYGDCLTDDDMKDFFAEFDTGNQGEYTTEDLVFQMLQVFDD